MTSKTGPPPPGDSGVAVDATLPATPSPRTPATPATPGTPLTPGGGRRGAALPAYAAGDLVAERYRIVRPLGEGGMGEVYEAEDLLLKERVALKTLREPVADDETTILRFKREIQLARRVTHPNVCRIFDVGLDRRGGRENAFLTMELIVGETLSARLRRVKKMTVAEAQPIVEQIAAALGAAHAAGIIHRDLKCANVLLVDDEQGHKRAVVTDFGLARAAPRSGLEGADQVTSDGGLVGSPAYMAPEQVEGGRLTPAADIYALGVVMFEMVTGQLPFVGETPLATAVMRVREDAPSARSLAGDLDPRWERTIRACLARKPEERPATAFDVVRGLRGDATFDASSVGPGQLQTRELRAPGSRRTLRRKVAIALVLALAGGVLVSRAVRRQGVRVVATPGEDDETAAGVPPVPGVAPVPPVPPVPPGGWPPGVPQWLKKGGAAVIRRALPHRRAAVAIMGFRNLSSKKELDYVSTAVGDMLGTELTAGEELNVVSGESVARAQKQLGLPAADTYASDTLRKLRGLIDADYVVTGSYLLIGGDRVRLDLKLQNTRSGETVAAVTDTGELDDLSSLVESVAEELRGHLQVEEPTPGEREENRGLMPTRTDVTRLYSEGLSLMRVDHCAAARAPLEQAVATDPDFALAHQALSDVLDCLGYDTRALQEAERAVELSRKLPDEVRLQAEAHYYNLTQQKDKALAAYEELFRHAPDNYDFGLRLLRYQRKFAPEKARATLAALRRLAGDRDSPELDFVEAMLNTDPEKRIAALDKARASAEAHGARLVAASAQLSAANIRVQLGEEMDAALEQARKARETFEVSGDRDGVIQALDVEARVHQRRNDHAGAKRALRDALEIGKQLDSVRSLAQFQEHMGTILLEQGDLEGAERAAGEVLRLQQRAGKRQNEIWSRMLLARLAYFRADVKQAEQQVDAAYEIAKELDDDEALGSTLAAEAHIARLKGNPRQARELLAKAIQAFPGLSEQGGDQYLEGLLALDDGDAARAEAAARSLASLPKMGKAVEQFEREQLLLDALLEQGRTAEAKAVVDGMQKKLGGGAVFVDRMVVELASARLKASSKKKAEQDAGLAALAALSKEAGAAGFDLYKLRADLARARILLTSDDRAGKLALAGVIRDAKRHGMVQMVLAGARAIQRGG